MMRFFRRCSALHFAILLVPVITSACGKQAAVSPPNIAGIVHTVSPIIADAPMPKFHEFFDAGTTAIHSYVILDHAESMTGSFVARMQWFSPNDLRPPISQHVITVPAGQNAVEFTLENLHGLPQGPYQLIAFVGPDATSITASGSTRFFVGMSETDTATFLREEAQERTREAERRKNAHSIPSD